MNLAYSKARWPEALQAARVVLKRDSKQEEALRTVLSDARRAPAASPAAALPYMDGGAPKRGVDLNDTSRLWEA